MVKDFYIAGDEYAGGHRKNWMARTQIGMVTAVDRVFGKITVSLKEALTPIEVDISFGAFTLAGVSSSWFRYLPDIGAVVLIAFRPTGKPELVGYSPIDYSQLVKFKDSNEFKAFRIIGPGEFDLRSSGGAGFYATATGDYISYAGPTQFTLSADGNDARGTAGLFGWSSTGGEFRFGSVKRRWLDGIDAEHEIPSGAFSEFTVRVSDPITGVLQRFLLQMGDVFDLDERVPYLPALDPSTGFPLRARLELNDTSGFFKTSVEVNNFGDTTISIGQLAGVVGLQILGTVNRFFVNFLQVTIQALVNISIQAGANITLTAGANMDITAVGPITINGAQVSIGGGFQGLVTVGAIPLLIAHTHPALNTPSPELATALLPFQTLILRAS